MNVGTTFEASCYDILCWVPAGQFSIGLNNPKFDMSAHRES